MSPTPSSSAVPQCPKTLGRPVPLSRIKFPVPPYHEPFTVLNVFLPLGKKKGKERRRSNILTSSTDLLCSGSSTFCGSVRSLVPWDVIPFDRTQEGERRP